MAQKKGLGRGLGAYFDLETEKSDTIEAIVSLNIGEVEPNPDQPRKSFDQAELADLAESIKIYGILQPIIVTKADGFYKIIAGERRYRAARLAQLETIPAVVRDFDELVSLQIALVENLQRKDLNILEEALCYQKLIEEFSMKQDDVAEKVSKSRSAVANALRLLNLDKRVQVLIRDDRLSMGHGRALLGLATGDAQFELAERIIEDGLSVRTVEELVKRINEPPAKAVREKHKPASNPSVRKLEDELRGILGTKVTILAGKKKSKIEIEYYSNDDLDRILMLLKK